MVGPRLIFALRSDGNAASGNRRGAVAPRRRTDRRRSACAAQARASRMARFTAEMTALSEDVLVLASIPTPHSTRSPTAHST